MAAIAVRIRDGLTSAFPSVREGGLDARRCEEHVFQVDGCGANRVFRRDFWLSA